MRLPSTFAFTLAVARGAAARGRRPVLFRAAPTKRAGAVNRGASRPEAGRLPGAPASPPHPIPNAPTGQETKRRRTP